jgi:cation transport ATPase
MIGDMKPASIFSIPSDLGAQERLQRRHMLARLGLAWLVMMQVMMFAFPGYLRASYADAETVDTLDTAIIVMNWCSLLLTVPVLLYCAWPIWRGFLGRDPHDTHQQSMNWPIGLGIVVAFVPSAIATFRQSGEVYYESIAMFVAFVLTARYLALAARQSAGAALDQRFDQESMLLAKTADRVGLYFVSIQIALSIVSALIWYLYIDSGHALSVLVALFVMSCPCAMAMSVPSAQAAARAIVVGSPPLSQNEHIALRTQTVRVAHRALYGSLLWHLLMIPFAMIGLVQPWLAAITMLVSSLAVAFYAWHFYKNYTIGESVGAGTIAINSSSV